MQMNKKVWDWRGYIINYGPDNSTYKLVLLTLSCFMNSAGGSCFPSVKKLSECTSLGRTTVIKYLDKADKDGWIKKSIHGYSGQGWKRNEYTADIPEKVVQELNGVKKGGSPHEKGGSPHEKGGSGAEHYHSSNNSPNNSPSSTDTSGAEYPNCAKYVNEAETISKYLHKAICEYDPTHRLNKKKPKLKRWGVDFERAMRRDGRTEEQLLFVIDYIYKHNGNNSAFWAGVIESAAGIIKNFDKIKNQIKMEKGYARNKKKQQLGQYADSLYEG